MSFDKDYPNRKDWRKPYRKSKRFDTTCRNHGSCGWCRNDKLHNLRKGKIFADQELKDYYKEARINA